MGPKEVRSDEEEIGDVSGEGIGHKGSRVPTQYTGYTNTTRGTSGELPLTDK